MGTKARVKLAMHIIGPEVDGSSTPLYSQGSEFKILPVCWGLVEPCTGKKVPVTGNKVPVKGNKVPVKGNKVPVKGNQHLKTRLFCLIMQVDDGHGDDGDGDDDGAWHNVPLEFRRIGVCVVCLFVL